MEKLSIRQTNQFFIVFMMMYFGLSFLAVFLLPQKAPEWLEICVSQVVLISPVVLLLIVKKMNPRKFLGLSAIGIVDMLFAYVAAYCLMPLIYFINYITTFFVKNYVNGMMMDIYSYPLVVQLVLLALLPALIEEFIFRGFFFGSYRRKNVLRAALMSGLLFGLVHLNLNQFAYAFVIGIAFCILYEAADNIILPITAHFAINANSVLMLRLLDENVNVQQTTEVPVGATVIILAVTFGLGILGVGLFYIIVKKIAQRHNRLEILHSELTVGQDNEEMAAEKFVDIYMIVAVILSVSYMVMLEIQV